jgi:E3 ubiquitin-protein ligase BRE1
MPAAEPPVVSSESGLVKMEDRKRPAADNNDSAPPLKKQATTVNGATKPHPDADMPWKDDLEVCVTLEFVGRQEPRADFHDSVSKKMR